jgi:KipI family sensor histidine kinase inhibitor
VSTSTSVPHLALREYGDAALLVDVVGGTYDERWSMTQAIGQALRDGGVHGYVDVVASYQNLVVFFDPLLTDAAGIGAEVERLSVRSSEPRQPATHEIPVLYGGRHGPDLDSVAADLGMAATEVVRLHTTATWVVRFVGSPTGAPMMDGWDIPAPVARVAQPRARVEPGSVGVSGLQSTIYNTPSPGGWRLIGRTTRQLFDRHRTPPVPYAPGDLIRFVAAEDPDVH